MMEAHVKETEAETVAFIEMHGSYDQTPQGFGTLYQWVAEHGLRPTGPPPAVYRTPPGGDESGPARWELWAPITAADDVPKDRNGLGVKHVPRHMVATTMYRGPYEGIEATYNSLMQWVAENGYSLEGPPEEIYYSDPNEVPPEDYLTEIRMPVARTQ